MNDQSKQRTPVPPLKAGQRFVGPEHHGCINSGLRATLLKSKRFKGLYVVGYELGLYDFIDRVLLDRQVQGKRVLTFGSQRVYLYRSLKPAVEKFHALNQKVLDFNRSEAERVRRYEAAVACGDLAEALKNAD